MSSCVQNLLEGYGERTSAAARGLRELLETDPQRFVKEAYDALRRLPDHDSASFLLRLLVSLPLALEQLIDPMCFTEAEAADIARRMMAADPAAEVKRIQLIRFSECEVYPKDPWRARRLLSILGQVSDSRRILPILTYLTRHPDPHVQSKATLLIGKAQPSPHWLEAKLIAADPRVRANAVEALWNVNSHDAKALARAALRDSAHRVAANAAVALHRMGELSSIAALHRMIANPGEQFRAAGVWAMGETGDPRFLRVLAELSNAPPGIVKRNALRAMVRIRDRVAHLEAAGSLRVSVEHEGCKLAVELRSAAGGDIATALPTSFVVTQRDREIEILSVARSARSDNSRRWTSYELSLLDAQPGELCVTVYSGGATGKCLLR